MVAELKPSANGVLRTEEEKEGRRREEEADRWDPIVREREEGEGGL